jgi:hypothetical protein
MTARRLLPRANAGILAGALMDGGKEDDEDED